MRVFVICDTCGFRHCLERRVDQPGPIYIVCHDCEMPLQAELETVIVESDTSDISVPAWAVL